MRAACDSPYARWLAWAALLANGLLVLALPEGLLSSLPVLLCLLSWLFISILAAVSFLTFKSRLFFSTWQGWLLAVAGFVISGGFLSSGFSAAHPQLQSLGLVVLLAFGTLAFLSTIIFNFNRDIGLTMFGWATLISVWTLFFAWRGNDQALLILMTGTGNNSFIWIIFVACIIGLFGCIGGIGFLGHTLRIFANTSDGRPR